MTKEECNEIIKNIEEIKTPDIFQPKADLFLLWLDKQIDVATTWDNSVKAHEISIEADQFKIRTKTLIQIKEKYLSLKQQ